MASKTSTNQETSVESKLPPAPKENTARETSVDSAQFGEAADDGYDDYDDFNVSSGNKIEKRQQDRGGGGSGNVYSAKHVRAKESQQRSNKK